MNANVYEKRRKREKERRCVCKNVVMHECSYVCVFVVDSVST